MFECSLDFSPSLFCQIRQKQVQVTRALQEKYLYLNSYTEAVQLDEFAEFVIHTTN